MSNYLFNQTRLKNSESSADFQLHQAFEEARNRNTVRLSDRQLRNVEAGRALVAVNRDARIKWGQAVCQEFGDHFDLDEDRPYPDKQLFFVTLADWGCFTSVDEREVDVGQFIKHLRPGLRGLSYLGMLEPAYYVNIVPTAFSPSRRALFWHIHAICWGETADQISKRIAMLNKCGRYRPIAQGIPAAHHKCIPRSHQPTYHLAVKFGYMLKSPRKAYRLYQADQETVDGDLIGAFKQKKAPLRPGERISLFHQLKDQYLDRLTLAGGDGVDILRRAKRQALRDFKG
jgi:hypothetical protein